jgi:6-phosphogluconolactonase
MHPNGKFIYASNRGHNSIAVFSIQEDGTLRFVEHETENINFPRDFNLSADGKFMIVGNQKGNSIISLKVDPRTGELENTGGILPVSKPLAFEFFPGF